MSIGKIVAPPSSTICSECGEPMRKGPEAWLCANCLHFIHFREIKPDLDLLGIVPKDLPFIIAIPLEDFLRSGEKPVLRLWYACEIVEMLLRFVVTIGVFELRELNRLSPEVQAEFHHHIQVPMMGTWARLARAVAIPLSGIPEPERLVPEIPDFVTRLHALLDGDIEPKRWDTSFLQLRNHLAHGGGGIGLPAAEKVLDDLVLPGLARLFANGKWLKELRLVLKSGSGVFEMLHGTSVKPSLLEGTAVPTSELEKAFRDRATTLVLVRDGRAIPLSPLMTYEGKPSGRSGKVYSRQEGNQIDFSDLWGTSFGLYHGSEATLDEFRKLFGLDQQAPSRFQVQGFDTDLLRDAYGFVGRESELQSAREEVQRALENCSGKDSTRVLCLSGPAGIGKSFLLARLAYSFGEFENSRRPEFLVLSFRFRAGDHRCSSRDFLLFFLERVVDWHDPGDPELKKIPKDPKDHRARMGKVLKTLGPKKILLFLDGLDEILKAEPGFLDCVLLPLAMPGVVWFCSGRPERAVSEGFSRPGCASVSLECATRGPSEKTADAASGLSGLEKQDIHKILEKVSGGLMTVLLKSERNPEDGNALYENFLDRVWEASGKGNPLYIRFLVKDIEEGRITSVNQVDDLPLSLEDYLENLCMRVIGLGTLYQVVTPLVCHLAIAMEPMSPEALAAVLVKRNLIPQDGDPVGWVRKGLNAVFSIVRTARTSSNEEGFTLYHNALRDHILQSETTGNAVQTAKRAICDLVMDEEAWTSRVGHYLLRWGPSHLFNANRWKEGERLLTDLRFVDAKVRGGMAFELVEDYDRINAGILCPGPPVCTPWRNAGKRGVYCVFCTSWFGIPDKGEDDRFVLCPSCENRIALNSFSIDAEWTSQPPDVSKIERLREESRERIRRDVSRDLDEFADFVRSQAHVLARNPALTYQQARNEPDKLAPCRKAMASIGSRRYLRWVNKPQVESPCLMTLAGHASLVLACTFSPDGEKIVSGSADNTVRVWDARTGRQLHQFEGHSSFVLACAFSPDGRLVASGSRDATIRIWDIETGQQLHLLEGHKNDVTCCAFSPDGQLLVTGAGEIPGSDKGVQLDDVAKLQGSEIGSGGERFPGEIKWRLNNQPNGCQDSTLLVWEVKSGRLIRSIEGHAASIFSCAFSPDGRIVLSGSRDNTLRTWDEKTGKEIHRFQGHTRTVCACGFSPDGRRIVSGSKDKTLRIWEAETGRELRRFDEKHRWYVSSCAFSPDGKVVALGSWRNLYLLDPETGRDLPGIKNHPKLVFSCAFSPDGKRIASGSEDGAIRIWDVVTDQGVPSLEGPGLWVYSSAFSPDGKLISFSGTNDLIRIWDRKKPRELLKFEKGVETPPSVSVFSPDSRKIVMVTSTGLGIWDCRSGRLLRRLEGNFEGGASCDFSPDGKTIVGGALDSTLRIWEAETGRELRRMEGNKGFALFCSFSPDGKRIVSGSSDATLRVWDSATGQLLHQLEGHEGAVRYCSFSPDGRKIVSGSSDSTIRSWDAVSGRALRTMDGHSGNVIFCRFSPDGRSIVSSSNDRSLKIWNEETGEILFDFHAPEILEMVEVGSDGMLTACAHRGGHVYFLQMENFGGGHPILTPWYSAKDAAYAVNCSFCRAWSPISFPASEKAPTEIPTCCPGCGKPFLINDFFVEGEWREIEKAWNEPFPGMKASEEAQPAREGGPPSSLETSPTVDTLIEWLYSRGESGSDLFETVFGNLAAEKTGSLEALAQTCDKFGYTKESQRLRDHLADRYEQSGNREWSAINMDDRALAARRAGRFEEALSLHQEAEKIWRTLSKPRDLGVCLLDQGLVHKECSRFKRALHLFFEAYHLARKIPDEVGCGKALGNFATVMEAEGHLDIALKLRREELRLFRKTGDMKGLVISLLNQAIIFGVRKEFPQAIELWKQAHFVITKHELDEMLPHFSRVRDHLQPWAGQGDILNVPSDPFASVTPSDQDSQDEKEIFAVLEAGLAFFPNEEIVPLRASKEKPPKGSSRFLSPEKRLSSALELIQANEPEKALQNLLSISSPGSECRNAVGVCYLRLGRIEEARDLFLDLARGDSLGWRKGAELVWKRNLMTAFLCLGNVEAFETAFRQLSQDELRDSGICRLRTTLEEWKKSRKRRTESLPWFKRAILFLGLSSMPVEPVKLDFPPGDLE